MDTIVVMDTVVVLLGESTKGWLALNAFWLIPAITVFVTMLGIIISAWLSIRNTNKQIKNSREITDKQLKASINNTNKQIKNQNKEGHRPYLKVLNFDEVKESFMNSYLFVKNDGNMQEEVKTIHGKIWIRNLGYGTATNIFLMGFAKTVFCKAGVEQKEKTGELFSILDIGLSENKSIKISLSSNNNSSDITYELMLFYTDLNKNIYSTMLLIQVKNNKFWNLYYYPHGSLNFDDILEKRDVKYKDLEKEYIKWKLNKKP